MYVGLHDTDAWKFDFETRLAAHVYEHGWFLFCNVRGP